MSDYFWADNTEIPPDLITYNFSAVHITWAFTALVCIVLAVLAYRRQSPGVKHRVKRILVTVMVCSELAAWIWKALIGRYDLQDMLPLHLCGISIFLECAAVYGKRTPLLKEFSYALSMPSALLAIMTPGWYYPFLSFQYLQSALLHSLLILIPALFVWGDGLRPSCRQLPKCFLLLLFFVAVAAIANIIFGGNYMFLCYAPEDTLLQVFSLWFGHPGYIFSELVLLMIVWVILYLPWIIAGRKERLLQNA